MKSKNLYALMSGTDLNDAFAVRLMTEDEASEESNKAMTHTDGHCDWKLVATVPYLQGFMGGL